MVETPNEIKELFRSDNIKKNVRVHFPNGERADLTNENIVSETLSYTESICSRDAIKFGLCESSCVQFQCVGIENIRGYEIECGIEIDISSLDDEFIAQYGRTSDDVSFPYYYMPYGRFIVDSCQRQSNMTRRNVIAYTSDVDCETNNALETAKFSSFVSLTTNRPYTCDLGKVLFSSINFSEPYFKDMEACAMTEVSEDTRRSYRITFNSINPADGLDFGMTPKYNGVISFKWKYVDIENPEDLLWLEYKSVSEEVIGNIAKKIKEIAVSSEYAWGTEYITSTPYNWEQYFDFNKMMKAAKYGMYYNGFSTVSNLDFIALSTARYIYPFIDGDSTYNQNSVYPRIYIPYSLDYKIIENVVDGEYSDITSEVVVESGSFDLRNKDEISVYTVNYTEKSYMKTFNRSLYGNQYVLARSDMVLNDAIDSFLELKGLFGKYLRNGGMELINISNNFGLFPSETLYPRETLYPKNASGGIVSKGLYQTAWYDDELTKPYGAVVAKYSDLGGNELYAEETIATNTDDYQVYDISENYFIQNCTEIDVESILKEIADVIKDVRYMPASVKMKGLPYLEAGDVVEVLTSGGGFETFMLRRTITGIQSLNDTIEARGE